MCNQNCTGFGSDTYVAPEKTLEPEQIDPLEDPDSKYLTLRFDRKLELIRRNMEDPQISRLTDESVHLISFESKGNTFISCCETLYFTLLAVAP